ncbi:MAG TPA: hypothetical protein VN256_20425 [Pyrinomonadaceae bacterium]|nr:hypothetical protein [Pyrinomonadaceae bacterium]
MKNLSSFEPKIVCTLPALRSLVIWLACLILLASFTSGIHAQKKSASSRARKLPSAEKIVGDYLKATGGKKRQAAIKDATYEWEIQSNGRAVGGERKFVKAPVSTRSEIAVNEGAGGDVQGVSAVSARSAWRRTENQGVRTLTDAEADADRLAAALDASRLIEYKKLNVLARTVAYDETLAEPAYVVEFSTKRGARLRYWFGAASKLLLKTQNQASGKGALFGDYRAGRGGVLEPHSKTLTSEGQPDVKLALRSVSYDTGLSDALFDPPAETEALDIPALLREVEANQKEIDERVSNYSFTEKRTEREISGKGELKKEKVTVSEIYPLLGGGTVQRLISENGVPLSAERAAKQDKEIAETVAKYEREREKREIKRQEEARKGKKDDDDVGITIFLRACEFLSPRRERLRDREAVVFDFRPRPGFKPNGTAESIVSKLSGVVWIDPADKTVMRLEAKLAESYKIAGGLFASIRPGSAFVFEQTRMADGVWLPRFMQLNFAAKILLFKGIEANETREFSDYRRFDTEASDYKLGAPAAKAPAPPNQ